MKVLTGSQKTKAVLNPLTLIVIIIAISDMYFLCASLKSSFPFGLGYMAANVIAVGLLSYSILTSFFRGEFTYETVKLKVYSLFVVSLFIFAAWSAYWWIPSYFSQLSSVTEKHFADGIVLWQFLNISYVALPLVGLLLVEKIISKRITNPIIAIVSGIFLGSFGYFVAGAVLVFLLIDLSVKIRWNSKRKVELVPPFLFLLSAVAALFFSHSYPGFLIERKQLDDSPNLRSIFSIVAKNLSVYVEIVFSLSSAIAVLSGVVIYSVHKTLNGDTVFSNSATIFENSQRFLTLSILAFFIAEISRKFTYGGSGHEYPARTYLFLSLIGFGVAIGSRLYNYHVNNFKPLLFIAVFLSVCLYVFSFYTMSQSVSDGKAERDKGYFSGAERNLLKDKEVSKFNRFWLGSNEKM